MSHLTTLFPHLRGFRLLTIERHNDRLMLACERVTRTALCPLCGRPARRIHSRYLRTVLDLPVQQMSAVLRLHVRKFYCDVTTCPRRIFTERLPEVTPPHGRYTQHLRDLLGQISQQQGGEAGARLAHLIGIPACGRTLLRILHARPLPSILPPTVVGLDDWAWKKRQRYGAIVVDLERRRPIALLPDRSVITVQPWLAEYPTITMVARDRSKEFATAITQALPQAQQIADRWHLAHNLTEVLDKVITARWKQVMSEVRAAPTAPDENIAPHMAEQEVGEDRYQQVLALVQVGVSIELIAQRLGSSGRTVRRWLTQGHGPYARPRKARRRTREQDWALTFLQDRWDAGERNGTLLWHELQARGYHGSMRSVYRRLAAWRQRRTPERAMPPRSPWETVTPSRVVGWMLARPETLAVRDQQQLAVLCQADAPLEQAYHFMQEWLAMIRQHTAAPLDAWLEQVRRTDLPQWLPFARSVERDKAAVVAGLTLPYSTGPVEGHIHKLKLIKRQAYGRASLAYLQQRLLA